jgi:choline dehydrogenase
VRTEAFVLKINMEGTRATGVTYRRGGVTQMARANAEIVLSAGAVASPQLLMLSGIGPGAHLRAYGIDVAADVAAVGQNLQDHPVSFVLFYTKDTTDLYEFLSLGNVVKAQKAGRGPLTSNCAEAGGFFRSRSDMEAPDLQFHMAPAGFYDHSLHEPVRRGEPRSGVVCLNLLTRATFNAGQILNLDASDVVIAGDSPSGAHSDIFHPELAWVVAPAGGLKSP